MVGSKTRSRIPDRAASTSTDRFGLETQKPTDGHPPSSSNQTIAIHPGKFEAPDQPPPERSTTRPTRLLPPSYSPGATTHGRSRSPDEALATVLVTTGLPCEEPLPVARYRNRHIACRTQRPEICSPDMNCACALPWEPLSRIPTSSRAAALLLPRPLPRWQTRSEKNIARLRR